MKATQPPRLRNAARMRDHFDLVTHVGAIIRHCYGFAGWIEPTLQPWIVCRHASWTSILVAFQCLNAAERKHEAARRTDEIGSRAKGPGRRSRIDEFSGRN